MKACAILLVALGPAAYGQNILDFVQSAFKDASFTAVNASRSERELAKINKDFALATRVQAGSVKLKAPFMIRMESTVDDTKITYVFNGARRLIRLPESNVSYRENFAKSPGKRQTALDFGLLIPALFDNLFTAKFVRVDRATGDHVFDLTYIPSLEDGTRHRVWIDKERRFMTRREWYSQIDGRLMATFTYEAPVTRDGVAFPTKITVRNAQNKVAGVTEYRNLKVNEGISDSLFKVD